MLIVVVCVLGGYETLELRTQYGTPLVIDVTARQQALVERYVEDLVLKLDGVGANPVEDADTLMTTANGLVLGGMVPAPRGNLDDLVRVRRPSHEIVRSELSHERTLVRQLIAEGTALLRAGKSAPSFRDDLRSLRAKAAELATATSATADAEAHDAQKDLSRLVRIQLALGAFEALVGIAVVLLLHRSARRSSVRPRSRANNAGDLLGYESEDDGKQLNGAEPTSISAGKRPDHVVVLLVEDNHMSQLVATRMLAKLGYRSDVANNGREALLAITAVNYSAVLMDCQMPEMDGYEATRQLRQAEHGTGRHLPVIAMTAAATQDDGETWIEAGMDDHLTKPVRPDAIAEVLERWIPLEPSTPIVPGHPSRSDELRVLDHDRLAVLRRLDIGDDELLGSIIREYLDEGAALLVTLREALAEGDPQTVERAACALEGASNNIGARHVSEICAKLESLGRAGALGTAPRLVDEATVAFERVRSALAIEGAAT